MYQKTPSTSKKTPAVQDNRNAVETLKDFGSSMAKGSLRDVKKIGSGMLDQFFGGYPDYDEYGEYGYKPETRRQPKSKAEFKIFNYQEYYESQKIKEEIKKLTELIKKEIELLKRVDKNLLGEVKDIQRLTVETMPSKPGIYHIRFLEIVLSILKTVRAKVNESATWLEALKTKKKKRGSLFMSLSKKKGTQYSLSSELNTARAVQ